MKHRSTQEAIERLLHPGIRRMHLGAPDGIGLGRDWRFVHELRCENRMIRLLEIRLDRARTATPGDYAF
jgi:hypothetical protein